MSTYRAIIALAVPVGAALIGLLWFFRRKEKAVDPPDKVDRSVKDSRDQSTRQETSSDVTTSKTSKDSNNAKGSPIGKDDMHRDEQGDRGNPLCDPVSIPKIETKMKIELELQKKSKNVVLDRMVNHIDDTGDHSVEKILAIEEKITVSESKPIESISPAAASSWSTEKDIVYDTAEDPNIFQEEIIAPVKLQGVLASPEVATNETDSDKIKGIIASGDKPNERKVADNEELCKNNADCESSNSKLSRSWHEEVSEQCDNEADNEDQIAKSSDIENKNKSPKPQIERNGVSSESDGTVSSDRLTKSPLSSEKRGDDAQTSSDASSNCDNLSEASNDSGKGGSVTENSNQSSNEEKIYEFNIPSDMCGLFIGTRGKTIKNIRDQSGARIRLRNNPYTPEFQICVIEGHKSAIEKALSIIKRKFPSIKYPGMDMTPLPTSAPVIMPEIMQLGLPEGVSVDIVVSSIVDAGRLFVQQPTHPTFPSLERLNAFMNQCYLQDGSVPDIPRPIESGVICAAPMLNGWYRAQIMTYYEKTDECDIKYVDYGGYSHISSQCLKQIRSDFMTLPFEAVECYLGNITALDNEGYFSSEAAVVLEELTQGKLLQAQVVGRAEDGVPYVHIYQINGNNSALMVNREMVNRGVVRWIELMS